MADSLKIRTFLLVGGMMVLFAGGCVAPKQPSSLRLVRVALVQDAGSVTLSSRSALTLRDTRTGKVLSRSKPGAHTAVSSSSQGMNVAGKAYPVRSLLVKSRSNEVSLNGRTYPGTLRILLRNNRLLAVNLVGLQTYLKAVVPSEMLPTWPREALKAQAVVSRSFVLFHAFRSREKDFDITSTTQVYNPEKRDPRTDKAVDDTKNIVLFYKGKLLLPFFSTNCGGFTEYAANVWETDDPFPDTVQCPFCRNAPDYEWRARMTLDEFRRKLLSAGIPSARSIAVHRRSASGGRITALKVRCENDDRIVKINPFRMAMGPDIIRSGFFNLQIKDGYITFTGHGWGHGVGMCQRGAKVLAERGKSLKSILKYYFPDTRTKKLRW